MRVRHTSEGLTMFLKYNAGCGARLGTASEGCATKQSGPVESYKQEDRQLTILSWCMMTLRERIHSFRDFPEGSWPHAGAACRAGWNHPTGHFLLRRRRRH